MNRLVIKLLCLFLSLIGGVNSYAQQKDKPSSLKKIDLTQNQLLPTNQTTQNTSKVIASKDLHAWCRAHNVQVYAQVQYDALSETQKAEVDASDNHIIYQGEALTIEDIYAFKRSKSQ